MKEKTFLLFLWLLACPRLGAQDVSGIVVDSNGNPLVAVSVVMRNASQAPVAYTQTGSDGKFHLKGDPAKQPVDLQFSQLGLQKVVILLKEFINRQQVTMTESATLLREVDVKARKIRQAGDTLNYSVAGFRQKQDRSIADVIRKMPGLSIENDGTIKYQGQNINKFYIEGMDLLGGKYSIASENLTADAVKSVQVLRNHQPVKALKNINFSEQAALNIVLKDDAKNVWQGTADIGAGHTLQGAAEWLRNAKLIGMLFSRKKQNITMYKTNNTGQDIRHEIIDLVRQSFVLEPSNNLLGSITLPAGNLKTARSTFNDSHMAATNWLFKTPRKNDLRLQLTGFWDKTTASATNETLFIDAGDGAILTEDRQASSYRNEWEAEMLYEANKTNHFFSSRTKGHLDLNRATGWSLLNGQEVSQYQRPRKRSLSNDTKIVNKLNHGRALTFDSQFTYAYLPGQLLLTDQSTENLQLHTMIWHLTTSFKHPLAGFNVAYNAGLNMRTDHLGISNLLTESKDRYKEYRAYLLPSITYRLHGLRLSASTTLSVLWRTLNDKRQTNLLAEPSASIGYDFNAYFTSTLTYQYRWTPAQVQQMAVSPLFDSYTSLSKGSGELDNSMAHSLALYTKYENPIKGWFGNLQLTYSNIRHARLYDHTYSDGLIMSSASPLHANLTLYRIGGEMGKSLGWGKLSISAKGNYSWRHYHLLLSDVPTPYAIRTAMGSVVISYHPLNLLSIEEESTYTWSKQENRNNPATSNGALKTFNHQLRLFFMPGNWQMEWTHELYHGNDQSISTNYFSDLSVSYRTNHYEISLACNNLFGTSTLERHYFLDSRQMYSINQLRPREFLASVTFGL